MIYIIGNYGKILRAVNAPDSEAALNAREGEVPVCDSGVYAVGHWYYTDGGFKAVPDAPGKYHEWDYKTATWVLNTDVALEAVRALRDRKLTACDWTQLPDVPASTRDKWAGYRQLLRDITESDITNVVWPSPPE